MDTKLRACLEITQKSVKLLIGHCLDEQPFVVYTTEESIEGMVKDGSIVDREGLCNVLKKLVCVRDAEASMNCNIGEVAIVLPPFGFKIYSKQESTISGSADKQITKSDINTIINRIKNENIPNGNELVDIIPTSFTINDSNSFINPPIGMPGPALSMHAMVHTLPKAIALDYPSLANSCGFRVKKSSVSPYCQAQLFATDPSLPQTYILVDMGANATQVSLIIGHHPYRSATSHIGSDTLTAAIANDLGVSLDKAEELKTKVGYDERTFFYRPPLAKGVNPMTGAAKDVGTKELNAAIENYFTIFFEKLDVCISSFFEGTQKKENLPIILTGGGSKLNGLSHFYSLHRPQNPLYIPRLKIVGGEDPRFSACLGLLIACSHYSGTLEDNYHGVASVSRVDEEPSSSKKEKRVRDRQNPSEDNL